MPQIQEAGQARIAPTKAPQGIIKRKPADMIEAVRAFSGTVKLNGWSGLERDEDGTTFLHYACLYPSYGSLNLLVTLLTDQEVRRAAKTLVNKSGETLLHYACRGNHLKLVRHLVNNNLCDLEATNSLGQTALFYACYDGHESIVKELISGGANVHALDHEGAAPLHFATFAGHLAIVKLLVENNADPGLISFVHTTPLHNASIKGHSACVAYLLSKGVPVDLNPNGITALHEAALHGHIGIAQLLIAAGASVNSVAEESRVTPLINACWKRRTNVVRELLRHKPSLETTDYQGNTALHYACENNDGVLIRLLLEHGASEKTMNNLDLTPINLLPPYSPHRGLFSKEAAKPAKAPKKKRSRSKKATDSLEQHKDGQPENKRLVIDLTKDDTSPLPTSSSSTDLQQTPADTQGLLDLAYDELPFFESADFLNNGEPLDALNADWPF